MKKLCFVIMGYGKKTDPVFGKTFDLDITYSTIIKPAVVQAGYECVRGDEILESGLIDKSMYALLVYADLVIADITTFNPNAVYELGIRHAAKPFSTIIMKERDSNLPFDLNHNKIFTYAHMGEDIGVNEATRCVSELFSLIKEVELRGEIDSPLFYHLKSVEPYRLPEEEYNQIILDLAAKEKSIFALSTSAKVSMREGRFSDAASFWERICAKVSEDAYFVQQWALCTYKDKSSDPGLALVKALGIIERLNPGDRSTTDPETLGITGAIYKRLWLRDKESSGYLDKAIDFYKRGFTIAQDYYTGENYALCMDLKYDSVDDTNEKIYIRFEAKRARREIIEIVDRLRKDEDFAIRSDLKWIYATLANCNWALEEYDEYKKYENLFLDSAPEKWEKESYFESLSELKKIYNTDGEKL